MAILQGLQNRARQQADKHPIFLQLLALAALFEKAMSIPATFVEALQGKLGARALLTDPADLRLYEYDGGVDRHKPDAVVFPRSTEDVVAIVKTALEYNVPIVGRGEGTGLSGGSIPRAGGIVISFSRMNRILEIDIANERAVVQP